jgi:restriction system protein
MARRRGSSSAEDLFGLVAKLPWWVGVSLAIGSYAILHHIAGQQVNVTSAPGQLGATITANLWKSLANVFQYVLPIICLAAALGSALGRSKRRALVDGIASNTAANALDGMTWREFELLVEEAFRLQGYQVVETGGGGKDGGVDLELRKERETYLVQSKQWKAYKVGVTVLRELFGVMAAKGAAGGFVVTSGRFTREATKFASGRNLKLIEGPALLSLIRQVQSARSKTSLKSAAPQSATVSQPATAPPSTGEAPACPKCGSGMIRRKAKRGAHAGEEFWGCRTYPTCRGVRRLDQAQ